LLVIAKNNEAHRKLSEDLKEHNIKRVYVALIDGTIKENAGTIDAPIGRHPTDRKKMSVNLKNGRKAISHFKVLQRFVTNTLVEVELETGRTHQIRVHMAYIGHPVTGDTVYGRKKQIYDTEGQVLHARQLELKHPRTSEMMTFHAPLPEYFEKLLILLNN
jgi:23S rRNA pseudouridine1911/1915/1917 synthase